MWPYKVNKDVWPGLCSMYIIFYNLIEVTGRLSVVSDFIQNMNGNYSHELLWKKIINDFENETWGLKNGSTNPVKEAEYQVTIVEDCKEQTSKYKRILRMIEWIKNKNNIKASGSDETAETKY